MEKKKCLQCREEYQPKKETSKFCSTSCRVMWNRKNGNKTKEAIQPFQLQVLYNLMVEKLEGINYASVNPAAYDGATFTNITHDEPKQWQEQKVVSKSFQQYMNEIAGLEYEQEFKTMAIEIQSDEFLSQKQKELLIINMKSPKS